jgi:hypothetical protein
MIGRWRRVGADQLEFGMSASLPEIARVRAWRQSPENAAVPPLPQP